MKIAVLSGKGGTGKTFVSVNLADVAKNAVYIDCDVEEPNGHIFFKPENLESQNINVKMPLIYDDKCNGCRKCVDFCRFNALAFIKNKPILFSDICHSCGGCVLICPEKAISETEKIIGEIQKGTSENVTVMTGFLKTGEASGVPIINKLISKIPENCEISVVDCPPGSACVVMESIKDADFCVLVAEPTLFGTHNLNMVYELVKLFKKPFGVVLNKCIDGENPSEEFCKKNSINILEKIEFSSELGDINSNGLIAVREKEKYRGKFARLLEKITGEVANLNEKIINP